MNALNPGMHEGLDVSMAALSDAISAANANANDNDNDYRGEGSAPILVRNN